MLLLESIGLESDQTLMEEYKSPPHSEGEDLDFELCFTEHEDADAWSGASLEKWCNYEDVAIDDDWDHVEEFVYDEFDIDDISDEQAIHVCPDDKVHAPKTLNAAVAEPMSTGFEVVQHTTLTELLVDIIFNGIRFQIEVLKIVAQEIEFLSQL